MTTIQINDLITLPLHLKQSSCPNYFFLLADPLFLSSRWQVVEKRGKIILASSRVHSHTASLVSAHRSKAIPDLFRTTIFFHASNLNFPMFQIWRMNCHLCDRLFFLTFLHSSTTFPMDVMEGLDNEEVGCGWCKVMQMNKLQFDQQKIIQAIQQCIKTNEIVNSIAEEGGFSGLLSNISTLSHFFPIWDCFHFQWGGALPQAQRGFSRNPYRALESASCFHLHGHRWYWREGAAEE